MAIFRLLALVFIVVGLMLLGADIVTTLEKGGALALRSLATVLGLVNADPSMWVQVALPASVSAIVMVVLGWPGWAFIGGFGVLFGAIGFTPRHHDHQ